MSILEKAALTFERDYGIDRIYETIYMYGDSEWADSLGQQVKSCPNCDILIKLHAGMFFPTIEARSKPENEFAFLYTQDLKDRLLEFAVILGGSDIKKAEHLKQNTGPCGRIVGRHSGHSLQKPIVVALLVHGLQNPNDCLFEVRLALLCL